MQQEGPIEIYERARSTLVKSLMDGIDTRNSAADFYFSLLNLQRHEAIYPWKEEDSSLQKMADIILKDRWEGDDTRSQDMFESVLGEGGGYEGIRETEGSLVNHNWKGRIKPFHPPVIWEGGKQVFGKNIKTGLMHGAWPGLRHPKPGEDSHFTNDHGFSSDNHPLLQGLEFGMPQFVETLASFYLRPDPHTPSLAEQIAKKEREYETHHSNHVITQPLSRTEPRSEIDSIKPKKVVEEEGEEGEDPLKEAQELYESLDIPDRGWFENSPKQDEEDRRDEPRYPFLGPLLGQGEGVHGVHSNDMYNNHYQNWLQKQEKLDPQTPEEEWEARKEHMNYMANQWVNGENHTDDEGNEHAAKLGWLGYMLGLEFLEPQERTNIVNHLMEHGSDYNQNSPHVPMGRIKRNFIQRSLPEYLWWYRHSHMNGPNLNQMLERPFQYDGDVGHQELAHAAESLPIGEHGDTAHDILLEHFNELMGKEGTSAHTLLPIIDSETGKVKKQKMHKERAPILSPHSLRMLAGYDENGDEMEEHPLYGEAWDGAKLTPEHLEELLNMAKDKTNKNINSMNIRNAAITHRAAHGPSKTDIEEQGLDNWYLTDTDGDHTETFASHFHRPFNKGGMNRSVMSYLEMLHDFLTTGLTDDIDINNRGRDIFSHSLIGTGSHAPNGEKQGLTFRQDMLGMLGSILGPVTRPPIMRDMGTKTSDRKSVKRIWSPEGDRLEGIMNLWETASPTPTNNDFTPQKPPRIPKTNITLATSTNHPRFAQKAMRMSDIDRKSELGTTMDWLMDGRNLHTFNPFTRLESPYQVHINPRTGGVASNRLTTLLGRLHSPTQPMRTKTLNFKDVMDGRVKSEHLPTPNADTWLEQQGLIQKPMMAQGSIAGHDQLRILDAMTQIGQLHATPENIADFLGLIPEEPSPQDATVDANGNTPHQVWQENRAGTLEGIHQVMQGLPEKVSTPEEQAMLERADTILNELHHIEIGIENARQQKDFDKANELSTDFKFMQEDLRQLEQALSVMPIRDTQDIHGKALWPITQHNEMLDSHYGAITNVAKDLRQKIEKDHPDLFSLDDPQTALSNMMQLFRFANRYLMDMPHDVHGQHAFGYGEDEIKTRSAADLLGQSQSPFANIAQGMQGLTARTINPNHSVEEVMQLLDMNPENPTHQKNAQKLLESLGGEAKIPLKISELHSSGLIPRVDPIDGDLHELAHGGDEQLQHGLRQAHQLFNLKNKEATAHGLEWIQSEPIEERKPMPRSGGSGRSVVKRYNNRLDGIDRLNSYILMNPNIEMPGQMPTLVEKRAQWGHYPIGPVGPNNNTVLDLLEGDRMNWGWQMSPDFMPRFGKDGSVNVMRSDVPIPTRLHSIPEPYLLEAFPEANELLNGPDLHLAEPNMMTMSSMGNLPTDNHDSLLASEDTLTLLNLTDPDSMLIKAGPEGWAPPIRPMHRIFKQKDLDALKGFSGDWVVNSIIEGDRLIVKKKGGRITAYDENGSRKSLDTGMPGSFKSISDDDYVIDGILSKDEDYFQVLDITKHMDDDVADLLTHERVKLLRAHYSSNDKVEIPAPHNTRTTDEEGLKKALENLKGESKKMYLLRDSQSTYMKGERRHPKWVLLRSPKELNFIVLDRKGKGPYSYRLGAGPLLDNEGLGNRAKSVDKKPYMDIGTIVRSDETYNVGDIVSVGVDSVTQNSRSGRDVYTIQAQDITGEGYGEGPASLETLSLLTKSLSPIAWPHVVTLVDNTIHVNLPCLKDDVVYKASEWPEGWQLHSPSALMGDMSDNSYAIRLSESLKPYWSPVAGALLKGMDNIEEEKKEEVHESEDDAEPLIEPKKIKDTFHKPEDEMINRALETALRALDILHKERTTSTGAQGLGLDYGTPTESPQGPTKLVNESALPDWDMKKRPAIDPEKPWDKKNSKSDEEIHEKVTTEEGDEADLDVTTDEATLSI